MQRQRFGQLAGEDRRLGDGHRSPLSVAGLFVVAVDAEPVRANLKARTSAAIRGVGRTVTFAAVPAHLGGGAGVGRRIHAAHAANSTSRARNSAVPRAVSRRSFSPPAVRGPRAAWRWA